MKLPIVIATYYTSNKLTASVAPFSPLFHVESRGTQCIETARLDLLQSRRQLLPDHLSSFETLLILRPVRNILPKLLSENFHSPNLTTDLLLNLAFTHVLPVALLSNRHAVNQRPTAHLRGPANE